MHRKCRSFYTSLNAKKELHKEFSSCRLLILWRMCDILYGDVRMAESADAADLKSASFGSTGSSPVPDTSFRCAIPVKSKLQLMKINFPRWSFFFLPYNFCSTKMGLLTFVRVAVASLRLSASPRQVPPPVPFFCNFPLKT